MDTKTYHKASTLIRLVTALVLLFNALIPSVGVVHALTENISSPKGINNAVVLPEKAPDLYSALTFTHPEPRAGKRFLSEQETSSLNPDALPPDTNCLDGECVIWINSSTDDAGENPAYCQYRYIDNEVYMGECVNGQDIVSGLRFPAINIPQGTEIENAYIEFTVDGPYSDELTISFYGEASGNANPFTSLLSSAPRYRPLTQETAPWYIPSTDAWALGEIRNSPDLTNIVQDIIDRSDWESGNALAIIMKNGGPASGPNRHRRVIGYDRQFENGPARLVIQLKTTVSENSIMNGGGTGDSCQPQTNATANELGPINTATGGLSYHEEDISIPTSAKPLAFRRTYASTAVDLYTTTLGYGWTHSLDTRLIFPDDPGGEEGYVLFKEHTANRYQFNITGSNTFSPAAGIQGSLIYTSGQYILTLPDQARYTFNSSGKLLSWADADGHIWVYSYNGNDQLEQVSADSGARYLTLSYNNQGRIESVSDYTGRVVGYNYNYTDGNLTEVTDILGRQWEYTYDSAHRMTEAIDPNGNTIERTEYDAQGRAVRQWDGSGNLAGELTYNADGTTTITDALGNVKTHAYDDRLTIVGAEDGAGGMTQKVYDPTFRPSSITDATGAITTLDWSPNGCNLTRVGDAAGGQTEITYDALNNPISVIDPLNYLTSFEYEGTLLTGVTNALNQETNYTYTPEGYLELVTDPLNRTTTFGYDAFGQRTSMTNALGNTWTYTYDNLGRQIDTIDPLLRVTHNEYDVAGRLVRSIRNYDPEYEQNDEDIWNLITEYAYDVRGNLISVTDTYGRTTSYDYDADDRLLSISDPDGNFTSNTYNDAGQLTATTDPRGYSTLYEYDGAGRLVRSIDPLGSAIVTNYNQDGTVASTANQLGRTTSYQYDELKRVVAVTAPDGGVTRSTYDEAGNLIASTDPLGNVTGYEYDALGRLIKQTNPDGGVTEHFYDEVGNLIRTKDPRGFGPFFTYDDVNRLETINEWDYTTTYEYDEIGRRTAVINQRGKITTYEYDALDRMIAVIDPLNRRTSTEYSGYYSYLGYAEVIQYDSLYNETTFQYDILGRLIRQYDAFYQQTSYGYDANGNRTSVTDPNNHESSTVYDALNRPVTTTDPLGNSASTTYDVAGQVVAATDPLGKVTTFTYDAAGRQSKVSDPLENETQYFYDAAGRMTGMLDANGIASAYEYDSMGRLAAVVENYRPGFQPDAETNVRTEYTYDVNGNRLTITDGSGNLTFFEYDGLNRVQSETDPEGNDWYYGYDPVGNPYSVYDANNVLLTYKHDDANQLTQINYPGTGEDVYFSYDAAGRRTSMSDSLGTTTWAYDDLYRPTAITDPFNATVGYSYDAVGNRTGLSYPDGKQVAYAYDAVDRLMGVTDWNSQTTQYSYDPLGRLLNVLRPNGIDSAYSYDAAGRLLALQHDSDQGNLSTFQYTYDNVGNRTQALEVLSSGQAGPTVLVTVTDSTGAALVGKTVYVFDGETYTGYNKVTDAAGQASLTLPEGTYRFRVDVDGTQFWSGESNHCQIAGCTSVMMTIPELVLVSVQDSGGTPMAGISVYAFDGATYTNFNGVSDENGQLSLRLPPGDYRFRADFNGAQFWSAQSNHCAVPGCTIASLSITLPVTVTVSDDLAMPQAGINVYAFDGDTYTNYNGVTDENGQVEFTLPEGDYRFRADFNNTQFWSAQSNHCTLPGCTTAEVKVSGPLTVTVRNTDGDPLAGLKVYAFDGSSYTGFNKTTDANGQVVFTLPLGSYRFRADLNGTQFWSAAANHCDLPGCENAEVTVSIPVTVTIQDGSGALQSGVKVYAFDGTSYTGYNKTSDSNGETLFTLPLGSYRFRADYLGQQYWSDTQNGCDIPGCMSDLVIVGPQPNTPTPSPTASATQTMTSTPLPATETATATPTPTPEGSASTGGIKVLMIRAAAGILPQPQAQAGNVTVTVSDTDGTPASGLNVYAFDGTTYTGLNGVSNANGQVTLALPDGAYRFRADLNGTQFWSGESNHCTIPACTEAAVTVTVPVTVSVQDSDSAPMEGLHVYAFNGTTYTSFHAVTDAAGQVVLTLPDGDYRFRADLNGTQFWSAESNHCTLPGCTSAALTVTKPVTITVLDTDGTPQAGLKVYAFDGAAYTNFNATTDANGQAIFTLPEGNYRFRADLNGTQFWSNAINHCLLPGCENITVIVTKPVTVTVAGQTGTQYPGLNVYAFTDQTYTGYNGVTDENGNVVFTLPQGNYHFRADYDGVQFWSGESNHCPLPGCDQASLLLPGVGSETNLTIDYTYDPLYRLTAADYDSGNYYHYTYDAVGNRLTQESLLGELAATSAYTYDSANRLTDVDGSAYTWDANGNLLEDGENSYTYDYANRLTGFTSPDGTANYGYNGLGDRLTQNGVSYTLDLNAGLTQVLADDANTYSYGYGRVSQQSGNTTEYFLGDALGSVRQMANSTGGVTFTQAYDPFGVALQAYEASATRYGFAGEYADPSGLVHLRARYYAPEQGRFFQQDPWGGDPYSPATLNPYEYALNNPLIYTDPSGQIALLAAIGLGFVAGVGVGAAVGLADRGWALSGECGCDLQEKAFSTDIYQWVGMHALIGGLIGGAGPILALAAAAAPLGAIIVGGLGIALGGLDLYNTLNIIKNETGWTWCTGIRAAIDILFIVFGTVGVVRGVQAWRASGSGLSWKAPTTAIVPYDPEFAAQQLLTNGKLSIAKTKLYIQKGSKQYFRTDDFILAGEKFQWQQNGEWYEVKWHSADKKAGILYGWDKNSAKGWTAQITIKAPNRLSNGRLDGGLLLGQDGQFYSSPDNITHIPLTR